MREAFCALIAAALLVPSGYATAGFADDNTAFSLAISMLRGAVGQHARALRIEADVNGVEIEAQDARNHNHINRWRYGTVTYLGIPVRRLTGPEPVDKLSSCRSRAAGTCDGPCMSAAAASAPRFSPMLKGSLSAPM